MTSFSDFEITSEIDKEAFDVVKTGLDQYAAAFSAPSYEEEKLSILRRNEEGKIVAGLLGKTMWNWLNIELVWVDEPLRHQGVGTAMVAAAEAEALKRGCHSVFLWTESFYMNAFYPKRGYTVFTVMEDSPIGHQTIGYMKRIS